MYVYACTHVQMHMHTYNYIELLLSRIELIYILFVGRAYIIRYLIYLGYLFVDLVIIYII